MKSDTYTDIYVSPEDDIWYTLEFEKTSNTVIVTYYDQSLPILIQKPIHKIIKHTYENSAINAAFSKVLNNYKAKREDKIVEYKPVKTYTKPKGKTWDLTDISNNMKPMPRDFRNFIFQVSGNNTRVTIKTFISKADIIRNSLDVEEMDRYLKSLDNFELDDRKAGWPKI